MSDKNPSSRDPKEKDTQHHDLAHSPRVEDSSEDEKSDTSHESQEDTEALDFFTADVLRQMGTLWIQQPHYASHWLEVIPEKTTAGTDSIEPNVFLVMDQFLIPASTLMSDFLEDSVISLDNDPQNPPDSSKRNSPRSRCIQFKDEPMDLASIWPRLHPIHGLLPTVPSLTSIIDAEEPDTTWEAMTTLPRIELRLPSPMHFASLLQVMYDMDLDRWEKTFTPTQIGDIVRNVCRLECHTELAVRCLEYYQRVREVEGAVPKEDPSIRELEVLYQHSLKLGVISGSNDKTRIK
ncbi:hypothetical protein BGW38_001942 [Lunasporangiospora selenospora]|uniref:Uncharacterized protein n=1 Tax=Lunasporangiospora selenospora TaxID=979761 RepID=A0A9P6KDT4_9FUNG|nr:hypothetical protein BGW38_001942 [Lunasporangiospora selenospora]